MREYELKSEVVLAADPGGRSGWAIGTMSRDRLVLGESGVFDRRRMALEVAEWQGVRFVGKPWSAPAPPNTRLADVIVVESWRPFRKNGSLDWIEGDLLLPAQHVGQFNLVAMLSGATYIEQHPSQKDDFRRSYPDILKEIDAESNELHDQDARLHLWGYFFTQWFTATKDPNDVVVV